MLEDLPAQWLQKFSQVIGEDVYRFCQLQSCLDKRTAKAVISPQQVAQAIAFAQARLGISLYYSLKVGLTTKV